MLIDAAPPPPIWTPAKPALIGIAEPWEKQLRLQLAKIGVPHHLRADVVAEIKQVQRIVGLEPVPQRVLKPTLEELARYVGDPLLAFLPGTFPGAAGAVAGGSGAPLTTFTFVDDTSDDIVTITPPAFQAGDLAVIFNAARTTGFNNVTTVVPSGFTSLGVTAILSIKAIVSAKKLDGSETTWTGMDGVTSESWICLIFRPDGDFTLNYDTGKYTGDANDTDVGPLTLTGSGTTTPCIVLGHMWSSGAISPRTVSPAMSEVQGVSTSHYAHYQIYNSGDTPASHSYDMDDESDRNIIAGTVLEFTSVN